MLDANGVRQLAYVVQVGAVEPIEGYDRVEFAHVNGWGCVVPKGAFKEGDLGIYFEIDSKCPAVEPFLFLEKRKYHVKTQKMCKRVSQGLLMAAADFGWTYYEDGDGTCYIHNHEKNISYPLGTFLTEELGITYYDPEDVERKSNKGIDKYKKMAQRHGKLFSKPAFKWLMKCEWGRKLLFVFFGKKRDKYGWPSHIAQKTDVERIQNMTYILDDKKPFVATEKVDGSSCSVMIEKLKFGRLRRYVCSRNVVFASEDAQCFYESNIYFEMYKKYDLETKIEKMRKELDVSNLAIQMEIYGGGVQNRDYSLGRNERKIAVFHILTNNVKYPMEKVVELCEKYDLPHVPILDTNYILPDTLEELQAYVEGENSRIDGLEKEGIVFYDKETGQQYFKFVSPNFLLKYHS